MAQVCREQPVDLVMILADTGDKYKSNNIIIVQAAKINHLTRDLTWTWFAYVRRFVMGFLKIYSFSSSTVLYYPILSFSSGNIVN